MALSLADRWLRQAVRDQRWNEAVQRIRAGRGGDWRETGRDGANGLEWAVKHQAWPVVGAWFETGIAWFDPSLANLRKDVWDNSDRTVLDLYQQHTPNLDPFPWYTLADETDPSTSVRPWQAWQTCVGEALKKGWLDWAERWWEQEPSIRCPSPTPMLMHQPWSNSEVYNVAQVVLHRDDVLATTWMENRLSEIPDRVAMAMRTDWGREDDEDGADVPIHPTAFGTSWHNIGQAAECAAHEVTRRWLTNERWDGKGPPNKLPIPLFAAQAQKKGQWGNNPIEQERWQTWWNVWLTHPFTQASLTERTPNNHQDVLWALITNHQTEGVSLLLQRTDWTNETLGGKCWYEKWAVEAQHPDLVEAVLARHACDEERQAAMTQAALTAVLQALKNPQKTVEWLTGETSPTAAAVWRRLSSRFALQGWDVNAPEVQLAWFDTLSKEWEFNRQKTLWDNEDVRQGWIDAGWSLEASGKRFPGGQDAYLNQVAQWAWAANPSSGQHEVWFGAQGWARAGLTPTWWRHQWTTWAKKGLIVPEEYAMWWLREAPDGVVDAVEMTEGLSSILSVDTESAARVVDAWERRGGPFDHPDARPHLHQVINRLFYVGLDERVWSWFDRRPSLMIGTSRWWMPGGSVERYQRLYDHWGRCAQSQGYSWDEMQQPLRNVLPEWEEHHRKRWHNNDGKRRKSNVRNYRPPDDQLETTKAFVWWLRQVGQNVWEHGEWHRMDRRDGEPLLVRAARLEDWDLLDALLQSGADVTVTDAKGYNALSYVVQHHNKGWGLAWNTLRQPPGETLPMYCTLSTLAIELLENGASPYARSKFLSLTVQEALQTKHRAWLNGSPPLERALEAAVLHEVAKTTMPQDAEPFPTVGSHRNGLRL